MSGVALQPVPGYPGYFAGDDGSVWSEHRGRHRARLHALRTTVGNRLGHRKVHLSDGQAVRSVWVHRVVCEAFHGHCPPGMEASHLDGDAANNRPENLRWESHGENVRRRRDHGTWGSRLTSYQVGEIRRRYSGKRGEQSALAREFGVTPQMVHLIVSGQSWSEVRDAA